MSFVNDLGALGGVLTSSVGEVVNAYADSRVQTLVEPNKTAQPEEHRKDEPIKGVNEKGQTLVVEPMGPPEPEPGKGFVLTKKHAVIGGGVTVLLFLGYLAVRK